MNTRRNFLACAAGITAAYVPLAAGATVQAAHPDAKLIAVARRVEAAELAIYQYDRDLITLNEDAVADLCIGSAVDGKRLMSMPPTTLEGLLAKARAVRLAMQNEIAIEPGRTVEDMGERHDLLAWSLVNDLLAGSAVA